MKKILVLQVLVESQIPPPPGVKREGGVLDPPPCPLCGLYPAGGVQPHGMLGTKLTGGNTQTWQGGEGQRAGWGLAGDAGKPSSARMPRRAPEGAANVKGEFPARETVGGDAGQTVLLFERMTSIHNEGTSASLCTKLNGDR